MLVKLLITLAPWPLRRILLGRFFGYEIHPTARIGLSWIFPRRLRMAEGSRIGGLNVAVHLDEIVLGEKASISRGNWITGLATGTKSRYFSHQPTRASRLVVGEHSAITKDHHLDCTNELLIGRFTTIAGYGSQFLTHSIDLSENRQHSEPIRIGDYCFVGTNVVVLGGASLPSHSVLGAKSLLQKSFVNEWWLYAGVPAAPKTELAKEMKYFTRSTGFVY